MGNLRRAIQTPPLAPRCEASWAPARQTWMASLGSGQVTGEGYALARWRAARNQGIVESAPRRRRNQLAISRSSTIKASKLKTPPIKAPCRSSPSRPRVTSAAMLGHAKK